MASGAGAGASGAPAPQKRKFLSLTALPNLRAENMAQLSDVPGEPEWFRQRWARLEEYCRGCAARGARGYAECAVALILGTLLIGLLSGLAGLAVGAIAATAINYNILGLGAISRVIEQGTFDGIWRSLYIRM